MSEYHEIAQRFDSYENQSLVDFFTVHLPCQILIVDTVGIERRTTPAITEFILRALNSGLTSINDVSGLLGLQFDYCQEIFHELELSEYIGTDAFGAFSVWKRGKELLHTGGENAPIDRRLNIVWDPLCRKFLGRISMYTRRRADSDGVVVPLAGAFSAPDLVEISSAALKESQNIVSGGRGGRSLSYEVLRVTTIQNSIARYREALALVYKADKGDISLRMVINGNIDDDLTTACAQASVSKLIGVDRAFSTRHGGLSVRKRYQEISKSQKNNISLDSLVRQRSLLRFKIESLRLRLTEKHHEELIAKKSIIELELLAIDAQLKNFSVLPVRCHEVINYLLIAFRTATRCVIVTTTMPKEAKLNFEVFSAIEECLIRGVRIELYIADRPNNDGGNLLRRLDKLTKNTLFNVYFLKTEFRAVFEIVCDDTSVCFTNESPLGGRSGPIVPREFIGYSIMEKNIVAAYCDNYVKFSQADLVSRIKILSKEANLVPSRSTKPPVKKTLQKY